MEAQEEKGVHDDKSDESDVQPSESDKINPDMPSLEKDISDGEASSNFGGGPEQNDMNLDIDIHEEPPHATRTQKSHSSTLVISDMISPMLTRKMCKSTGLKGLQSGLLASFLSQTNLRRFMNP